MKFSDSVLIESKTARDQGLSEIGSFDLQLSLLSNVKAIFFALWRDSSYLTTAQVAEFYNVPENTVRQNYGRCKAEFDADGVIKVQGDDLREVRDIMSLSSFTPQAVLFPARAVIRMGFILQESEVAAQVRTAALNVIQGVGDFISNDAVLTAMILTGPPYGSLIENAELKVSVPLESFYDAIARKLKSAYSTGGIPGLTKAGIRERLAALSTYTQLWKLNTQKELKFRLKSERTKYPDLVSDPILVPVDGEVKRVAFVFQIEDLIVDPEQIEESLGRQYIKRVKDNLAVDYAYLLFVAPFGATPDAQVYIQNELPSEHHGCVGVVTVQELAEFLRNQAWQERTKGLVKGDINKQFSQLLQYQYPSPLAVMMGLPL